MKTEIRLPQGMITEAQTRPGYFRVTYNGTSDIYAPFNGQVLPGKLLRDVCTLDAAEVDTDAGAAVIAGLVQCNFHGGRKIAGAVSCDGSSMHCAFCCAMAASGDPGCICCHCYARRENAVYPTAALRHYFNMRVLSLREIPVDVWRAALASQMLAPVLRFNADGDLFNVTEAVNFFRIAEAFPAVKCALYYKHAGALNAAVARCGGKAALPKNLQLVYSDPRINGTASAEDPAAVNADRIFHVYEAGRIKSKLAEAGAIECNGKQCAACDWACYQHSDDVQHVYEVLR